MIAVAGNTYPLRELFGSGGGFWNRDKKAWEFPDEKLDLIKFLIVPYRNIRVYLNGKQIVPEEKNTQLSLF